MAGSVIAASARTHERREDNALSSWWLLLVLPVLAVAAYVIPMVMAPRQSRC